MPLELELTRAKTLPFRSAIDSSLAIGHRGVQRSCESDDDHLFGPFLCLDLGGGDFALLQTADC